VVLVPEKPRNLGATRGVTTDQSPNPPTGTSVDPYLLGRPYPGMPFGKDSTTGSAVLAGPTVMLWPITGREGIAARCLPQLVRTAASKQARPMTLHRRRMVERISCIGRHSSTTSGTFVGAHTALAPATPAPPVGLGDQAHQHRTRSGDLLAGYHQAEAVESAEQGQVERGGGGLASSVKHVEHVRSGCVGTPIIGRPERSHVPARRLHPQPLVRRTGQDACSAFCRFSS
jgi:hypothetical protein